MCQEGIASMTSGSRRWAEGVQKRGANGNQETKASAASGARTHLVPPNGAVGAHSGRGRVTASGAGQQRRAGRGIDNLWIRTLTRSGTDATCNKDIAYTPQRQRCSAAIPCTKAGRRRMASKAGSLHTTNKGSIARPIRAFKFALQKARPGAPGAYMARVGGKT